MGQYMTQKKYKGGKIMAGNLMTMGGRANTNVCEFVVDSVDEIELLPTTTEKAKGKFMNDSSFDFYPPLGSTCLVGNEAGDLIVFQLFSFGWKRLS